MNIKNFILDVITFSFWLTKEMVMLVALLIMLAVTIIPAAIVFLWKKYCKFFNKQEIL